MRKRNTGPLPITSIPRSHLDSSQHGSVDVVLKDLKNCSRRLHVALGAFRDEYQVLERLYYKGKNQHRVALFWRRIVEIRRFCRRLDGLHIDQTVDTLRGSFFSPEDIPNNPKMMKGSWTHYPGITLVAMVLQCISMSSALLEKMQEKLLEAYRSFTLAMQSGAFLQLILILIAVVSRMSAVSTELQEILQTMQGIAQRISGILSTPTTLTLSLPTAEAVRDEATDLEHHHQDPSTSDTDIVKPSVLDCAKSAVPTGPARIVVERELKETKVAVKTSKGTKDNEHRRKKKREKPRDEIDDIFGF
ncbi:hypothetical protein FPV67DRAFT_1662762 [Lyophyllum atratum]|nr:hypothetical protein FPV67DRAFT_1662762 [Lyophyllum atratum]